MFLSIDAETEQPFTGINEFHPADPKELQQLYGQYFRPFVEEAGQLLIDKKAAPDLVNHSFIKLWLKCHLFKRGEYFAFLRTSVNMHCYNFNNSEKYSPEQQTILHGILLGLVGDGEDRQSMYAGICALPPARKAAAAEAFEKLYVRGLAVPVIAAGTGLSEEETQDMLHLAFKTLHLILSLQPI